MLKKIGHLLAAVGVIIGGTVTAAYAHPGHSTSHHSLTAPSSLTVTIKRSDASTHDKYEGATVAENKIERKALPSREVNAKSSRIPAYSIRATAAMQREGTCERANCGCTKTTHGDPYCYAGRGDCPNHVGLLCIW